MVTSNLMSHPNAQKDSSMIRMDRMRMSKRCRMGRRRVTIQMIMRRTNLMIHTTTKKKNPSKTKKNSMMTWSLTVDPLADRWLQIKKQKLQQVLAVCIIDCRQANSTRNWPSTIAPWMRLCRKSTWSGSKTSIIGPRQVMRVWLITRTRTDRGPRTRLDITIAKTIITIRIQTGVPGGWAWKRGSFYKVSPNSAPNAPQSAQVRQTVINRNPRRLSGTNWAEFSHLDALKLVIITRGRIRAKSSELRYRLFAIVLKYVICRIF